MTVDNIVQLMCGLLMGTYVICHFLCKSITFDNYSAINVAQQKIEGKNNHQIVTSVSLNNRLPEMR